MSDTTQPNTNKVITANFERPPLFEPDLLNRLTLGLQDRPIAVKFVRQSPFSQTPRSQVLTVTPEDYYKWKVGNSPIQEAMPYLTEDAMRFLLLGLMPGEELPVINEDNDDPNPDNQGPRAA